MSADARPALRAVPDPEPAPQRGAPYGVAVFTSTAGRRSYPEGDGWVMRDLTGQLDVLDVSGVPIATWAPGSWSGVEVEEASDA